MTVGRTTWKPAAVVGGCQTRTRHSISPSKWSSSSESLAVVTLIGVEVQRTGIGAVWP